MEFLLLFLQSFLMVLTPLLTTVERLADSTPLSESAENLLEVVSGSAECRELIKAFWGTISQ